MSKLRSTVFRKAAKRLSIKNKEIKGSEFSCIAIDSVTTDAEVGLYKEVYTDYFQPTKREMPKLFSNTIFIPLSQVWFGDPDNGPNQLARQLALLFMAEMIDSGDI